MTLEEWVQTKACCCPHRDAYECARLRDPARMEDRYDADEHCECRCHDDWMEEDEDDT